MKDKFEEFGTDTEHKIQAIFSSVFVLENLLQNVGEKLQTEITMKQWLLLAMTEVCDKPCTLTSVGNLMGCSRQNIKKLANILEKKGFIRFIDGNNNSVQIELTNKVKEYGKELTPKHLTALKLLFSEFTTEEIDQLFIMYKKLYIGIEKIEEFAKECE